MTKPAKYLEQENRRPAVSKDEFDNVVRTAARSHTTRICEPPFTTFWRDEECQEPVASVVHPYHPEDEPEYFVSKN